MNNGDQLKKANETHLHHTALMLACQDLESATYAARKAREDLRRATRNRLQAKERHDDARTAWTEAEPEDGQVYGMRVELLAWALDNATRDEADALEDYRSALKRIEVLGATAGEADSHEVPAYLRHRARKAIALADAFGNKVAMDATLHDGLDRPVLPELSPEVEVQEFRVIDPLEPVEAFTAPEPRAVLVPVDDYTDAKIDEGRVHAISFSDPREERAAQLRQSREEEVAYAEKLAYLEDARRASFWSDMEKNGYAVKVEKSWETEHMSPEWWKQVTFSAPLNVKDPLPEAEDENLAPVCPECRNGKHGNCDGTAWDDHEDAPASCSCLTCEAKIRENGEAGR